MTESVFYYIGVIVTLIGAMCILIYLHNVSRRIILADDINFVQGELIVLSQLGMPLPRIEFCCPKCNNRLKIDWIAGQPLEADCPYCSCTIQCHMMLEAEVI